jgi:hypothetical protein
VIQRPIDQIRKEDIESLISAKVSEKRTLDYKRQLPSGSDQEKREFLYDVSSFANSLGGDLVFGVTDERDEDGNATGFPAAASGAAVSNVSSEIARLENLIRDGIEPRIQGIQWKPLEGFPNGAVVVARVPKSLLGPHMVVFGGMARFYSRNSTGKYPMDFGEIRSAFVESMALSERLRVARTQALERVEDPSVLGWVTGTAKLALQLVPFSSLGSVISRDVTRDAAKLQSLLQPMKGTSWGGRYNFDGYLVTSFPSESYIQVFRSGVIEAGAVPFLGLPAEYRQIPSVDFERRIIASVTQYLNIQERLGIPLPIFAAITLLGVKGYRMSSYEPLQGSSTIDRDVLMLPEILIEDYGANIGKLLRPAFDALCQSGGVEKSPNYDGEGNWHAWHA